MKLIAFGLLLCALSASAQKNAYEEKLVASWGSQGNGGAEQTGVLPMQAIQVDCTRCVHGRLHLVDFGTGPFFIDDEGYVFLARLSVLSWTSATTPRDNPPEIREFANGVH